jgi:hypothetical protein
MIHARAEAARNIKIAAAGENNGGNAMLHRSLKFAALAAMLVLSFASASFAWNASDEVRRLNKEVPSSDSFKGAPAVVWQRNSDIKTLADGSMETTRYTIVMMGEMIPESWQLIKQPVPAGGKLEITEAAIYNPMTGLSEGKLSVTDEKLAGGADVKVIRTPNSAAGRAVVLVEKETRPKRLGVDETIEMAGPLPIWEQIVTVTVPDGSELYWFGNNIKSPTSTKSGSTRTYKWTVTNQEAWYGEGFIVNQRPAVSFSLKKGLAENLTQMEKEAADVPSIPLPSVASDSDKSKAGLNLMEWIADPARTLTGYPKNWKRPAEQIPANGPWTPWEQTLLLNKWLKALGWESDVWWQSLSALGADSAASSTVWNAPVLELSSGSGKKVFYEAGQAADYGVVSPALGGTMVYRHKADGYFEKKLSTGSAGGNRLSLLWILKLDENGTANGTLSVNVTGGWTGLFSNGLLPSSQGLDKFLFEKINFALPGLVLSSPSVKQLPTGYKLDFNVACTPGIVFGKNMLLRLPGGIPMSVGEMINKGSEYTFRFPFSIDQKVRMSMPHGYRLVQVPTTQRLAQNKKSQLNESIIFWPNKASLNADSTWIVKAVDVNAETTSVLRQELGAMLRWPTLNLPFSK